MTFRTKLLAGCGVLLALAGVAIAQVPALFLSSLTGTEQINGIEIDTTTQSSGSPLLCVNSGGAAAGSFVADEDYSGGNIVTVTGTISTSGVTNPAPQAVYQSNRYGAMTYTLPGFTAGTTYTVRLHFAETYWTATGQREFNVLINGTQVLTDYDIVASSGGSYKANIQSFNLAPNSSGQFVIQFVNVVDNAQINGIEIDSM